MDDLTKRGRMADTTEVPDRGREGGLIEGGPVVCFFVFQPTRFDGQRRKGRSQGIARRGSRMEDMMNDGELHG